MDVEDHPDLQQTLHDIQVVLELPYRRPYTTESEVSYVSRDDIEQSPMPDVGGNEADQSGDASENADDEITLGSRDTENGEESPGEDEASEEDEDEEVESNPDDPKSRKSAGEDASSPKSGLVPKLLKDLYPKVYRPLSRGAIAREMNASKMKIDRAWDNVIGVFESAQLLQQGTEPSLGSSNQRKKRLHGMTSTALVPGATNLDLKRLIVSLRDMEGAVEDSFSQLSLSLESENHRSKVMHRLYRAVQKAKIEIAPRYVVDLEKYEDELEASAKRDPSIKRDRISIQHATRTINNLSPSKRIRAQEEVEKLARDIYARIEQNSQNTSREELDKKDRQINGLEREVADLKGKLKRRHKRKQVTGNDESSNDADFSEEENPDFEESEGEGGHQPLEPTTKVRQLEMEEEEEDETVPKSRQKRKNSAPEGNANPKRPKRGRGRPRKNVSGGDDGEDI